MGQSMMVTPTDARAPGFGAIVEVRPLCVDDMAHVRYLHAASLRALANRCLTDQEIAAFTDLVHEPDYSARLLSERFLTAWLGPELVGTAGWGAADDARGTARIHSIFTRPMFTLTGIGRRLVQASEVAARAAGYEAFSVRTTVNAIGFFERVGYEVTGRGARSIGRESLAVAFMRKALPGPVRIDRDVAAMAG